MCKPTILLIAFILLLSGCDTSTYDVELIKPPLNPVELNQDYTNSQYGFSFKYPLSWEQAEVSGTDVAIFGPPVDDFTPNFNVITDKADPQVLKAPQSVFEKEFLKHYESIESLAFTKGKFHGNKCLYLKYKAEQDDISLTIQQYVFNKKDRCVIISYGDLTANLSKHQDIFDSILASFQVE